MILVKPQTYMNLSGECVKPFVDFYKIEKENILVIYDDMDIEPGKIKIRKKGKTAVLFHPFPCYLYLNIYRYY